MTSILIATLDLHASNVVLEMMVLFRDALEMPMISPQAAKISVSRDHQIIISSVHSMTLLTRKRDFILSQIAPATVTLVRVYLFIVSTNAYNRSSISHTYYVSMPDEDCAEGLTCFTRLGTGEVPGCTGDGEEDVSTIDLSGFFDSDNHFFVTSSFLTSLTFVSSHHTLV